VVASDVPSNETTDPAVNPAPVTVSVKAPAGIGEGLTDVMPGRGMMVAEAATKALEDFTADRSIDPKEATAVSAAKG
jgi:hypothetical protein